MEEKKEVNRARACQCKFYVSNEEKELIKQKIAKSGIKNDSDYYRKMIIDGYIVSPVTPKNDIQGLMKIMSGIAADINQIARKSFYSDVKQEDIDEIRNLLNKSLIEIKKELYKTKMEE